ncbi:hypothetical protein M9978_22795 [Sphingomonas sp. MG17]|uniref:Uncharacterized protein n=1 Tax=Sphingomonas tagetis TaxID=2949092 RepID=A0A9X2HP83_9SPHN|nr:hypothetical protein [Sphingomonas tagetis]MCP3733237.1 hypothetical protein [Sphingomonas tagetis]
MSGFFEIEATWPEAPEPDKLDVAEIAIRLGYDYLTRVADIATRTNRDYFRGSAVTLAFWLADHWWRLRSEPIDPTNMPSHDWRMRHELSSASGGTLWPPLMIYSGGERVIIAPILSRRAPIEPLQYLDTRVRMVTGSQFELGTDNFFNLVLDSCARSADAAALRELVGQLVAERGDTELAAWRKLEACLGFDPDQAPDAVVEGLLRLAPVLGAEEVKEAATAFPGSNSSRALETVLKVTEDSPLEVDLGLAARVDPTRDTRPYASPWELAESAAAQVRDIIGLDHGPIGNEAFGHMLLTRWETLKEASATARKLPYAARLRTRATSEKVAIQSVNLIDRRFEIARLLGDAIWTEQSAFGPISDARTDRQKFQRAFAQSLLCPFNDLRANIDIHRPELSIDRAARHFGVHRNVVRNLLAYKGVLRETLEDQLEAV